MFFLARSSEEIPQSTTTATPQWPGAPAGKVAHSIKFPVIADTPRACRQFFQKFLFALGILHSMPTNDFLPIAHRFRSFLPVVIDVETGGFNHQTDALLQIAAVLLRMDEKGHLYREQTITHHVTPFEGSNLEPESLKVNGIDPFHPLRLAISEHDALNSVFKAVRREIKANECTRAILVGHNAAFDLNFLNAAVERTGIKRNPFHPFSTFDTVSLSGLAFGQTVLSRSVQAAGISWDDSEAHSATYDAEKTADLFCHIVNHWESQENMMGRLPTERIY